ncbi:hypothetical protein F4782DRAFT_530515 [Xylaria castorea]|nr:hypothetical protein F4782DRAFT_530515 [Xylaria castorea]
MNQWWHILNVDKKEIVPNYSSQTMWEILVDGTAEPLVRLLTVPNLKRVGISQSGVDKARALNRSSPFVALPQELVDAITAEVSDIFTLLSLAVSCSYFWRTLLPRAREAIIAYKAPWAGDRLVVVGDYAVGLPSTCSDFKPDEAGSGNDNPLYAIETQVHKPLPFEKLFQPYRRRAATPPYMPIFSGEDHQLLCRLVAMLRYGTKRAGVLRNLSKRQYVLDTKLAESDYAYSLADAAIIRLRWTDDMYRTSGSSEWVGDRFDIRTADDVTGEWTDKSDETVEFLRRDTGEEKTNGLRAWVK